MALLNTSNRRVSTSNSSTSALNSSSVFTGIWEDVSRYEFEATTDTNDTFASCRFSGIEFRDVDA